MHCCGKITAYYQLDVICLLCIFRPSGLYCFVLSFLVGRRQTIAQAYAYKRAMLS